MQDQIQRELQYRQVALNDISRFRELIRLCFKLEVSDSYFDWKYNRNPAGPVVAFEAVHNDQPVAFYGLIPEFYRVAGQVTRIYQSMDTMTHPSYQKRGLFVKLANLTFEHVRKAEGRLDLVGIPGGNSFHGFVNRLGWANPYSFPFYVLHRAVFSAASVINRPRAVELKPVTELSTELREYFSRRAPSPAPVEYHFTPDFFNWRVFGHPYRGYRVLEIREVGRLEGYCVYIINAEGRVYVYQLDFATQAGYSRYLPAVLRDLFARTGASIIHTWRPLSTAYRHACLASGFLMNPLKRGPFSYRVPFITRSDTGKVNGVDWTDIRNFDLQPLMQD